MKKKTSKSQNAQNGLNMTKGQNNSEYQTIKNKRVKHSTGQRVRIIKRSKNQTARMLKSQKVNAPTR